MSKRTLQIILLIIAFVPIITGPMGMISGITDKFYGLSIQDINIGNIILDSNMRYFSGVWFGLGLVILWIIPKIEKHKAIFRFICGMIFLGGIGRVFSIFDLGFPSIPFIFFTLLELLFPLLIILQNKIADKHA